MRPLILLGAGGHAKVLVEAIALLGGKILGAVAPDGHSALDDLTIPILANDELIQDYPPDSIWLVNAVGQLPGSKLRISVFEKFVSQGYSFFTITHPSAVIASSVTLGQGVQIMAGAVVQPGVVIGENSIINTGCIVDHDAQIGRHVHLSPGAIICGDVELGEGVYIGAGAVIANSIVIEENAVIGCGSSVVRNIKANTKVIPASLRKFPPSF